VVTTIGFLSEIEQRAERPLQRRLLLSRRILGGQPLPRERADQVVKAVLAVLARSAARRLDEVGADQVVEQVLGVPGLCAELAGPAGRGTGRR
jgi:hypothetical protein